MGASWLLFAVGVGVQPTEFLIDTETPDALCPEISMTREAVRMRLGELEVEGGGLWRGRYSTVHDPSGRRGDYVRLIILDPAGKEQTSRELPIQGESCSTLAQAIALVIDGFFRDFGQIPGHDIVPTVPTKPENAVAGSIASVPTTPTAVSDRQALPPAQDKPKTSVATVESPQLYPDGRGGLVVGTAYESVPSGAAVSVGLFVAATHNWRFDLRATLSVGKASEPYREGTADLYALPVRLSLNYDGNLATNLRVFLGPEALVSFEHATTKGVESGHRGWRAALGAGAHFAVSYRLSPWLALAAGFSADAVVLNSRRFMLEADRELELPRARLAGTFELWGTIAR